jgi:hypothetical protein
MLLHFTVLNPGPPDPMELYRIRIPAIVYHDTSIFDAGQKRDTAIDGLDGAGAMRDIRVRLGMGESGRKLTPSCRLKSLLSTRCQSRRG